MLTDNLNVKLPIAFQFVLFVLQYGLTTHGMHRSMQSFNKRATQPFSPLFFTGTCSQRKVSIQSKENKKKKKKNGKEQ